MPLQIKLPAWDKIIINGAVLQNGGTPLTLIVHNRADILRRKEVMSEDQADTPARRAYYCLQCAYLFEDQRMDFLDKFTGFMEDYMRAAPSVSSLAEEIFEKLQEDRYYDSLRSMRRVLEHEQVRLGMAEDAKSSGVTQKQPVLSQASMMKRSERVSEGEEFVKESLQKATATPVRSEIKRKRRTKSPKQV